jgi:hypothetical protein
MVGTGTDVAAITQLINLYGLAESVSSPADRGQRRG